MSRTLQFKRYANTIVASTTGADGELIIDETNHAVTVHDGATIGGYRMATEDFVRQNLGSANTLTNGTHQVGVDNNGYLHTAPNMILGTQIGDTNLDFVVSNYSGSTSNNLIVTAVTGFSALPSKQMQLYGRFTSNTGYPITFFDDTLYITGYTGSTGDASNYNHRIFTPYGSLATQSVNTFVSLDGTNTSITLANATLIFANANVVMGKTGTYLQFSDNSIQTTAWQGYSANLYINNNITANSGFYAINGFNGSYSDGIIVDYVSGLGRITVGPADNLSFYTGGPFGSPTATLYSNNTFGTTNVIASLITASNGVGYATGSGGTISQTTSRTTGVTLNKPSGQITLFSQSMGAGLANTFVFTNSTITANDYVMINHWSGGTLGNYTFASNTTNGQANVTIRSISTVAAESPILQYVIIKGAAS